MKQAVGKRRETTPTVCDEKEKEQAQPTKCA
jgi:hypothetical protein